MATDSWDRWAFADYFQCTRDLNATAFRLMVVLWRYSDNETGRCFPSQTTLAEDLASSLSTVERGMRLLQEEGIVTYLARAHIKREKSEIQLSIPPDWVCPRTNCRTHHAVPLTDDGHVPVKSDGHDTEPSPVTAGPLTRDGTEPSRVTDGTPARELPQDNSPGRAGGTDQQQPEPSGTSQADPPPADTPAASPEDIARPSGEARPHDDPPLWDVAVEELPAPIRRQVLAAPAGVLAKLRDALRAAHTAGITAAQVRGAWDSPGPLAGADFPAGALAHRIRKLVAPPARPVAEGLPDPDAPRCPFCDGNPQDAVHTTRGCPLERVEANQDQSH